MKFKELLLSVKKLLVALFKFIFSWEMVFALQFLAVFFIALVLFRCNRCWVKEDALLSEPAEVKESSTMIEVEDDVNLDSMDLIE